MEHLPQYKKIKETTDGIVERCKTCKKRLITKKGEKGSIDNKAYLKEHARDFLQPKDKRFKKEWGEIKDFDILK